MFYRLGVIRNNNINNSPAC